MDKLIDISIDASIFAVNFTDNPEEDLERYLATLDMLGEILKLNKVTACKNIKVAEVLMENCKEISRLCIEVRPEHVGYEDIITHAQELLSRIRDFEDHHKIKEVSMTVVNFTPSSICTQCLASAAILRNYCEEGNQSHYIMANNTSDTEARIEAYISDISTERRDIAELPKEPHVFEESVPLFSDFYQLINCLNAEEILSRSEDSRTVELALHVAFFDKLKSSGSLGNSTNKNVSIWNSIRVPYVGEDFLRYWNRIKRHDRDSMFFRDFLMAVVNISIENILNYEILNTDCGKDISSVKLGRIVPRKAVFDDSIYIHFWCSCSGSIEIASIHEREVSIIPNPSKLIVRGR